VHSLDDLACQTDKGIVLAAALVQDLRNRLILLPSLDVIERISSETITRGNRRIYGALNEWLFPSAPQRVSATVGTGISSVPSMDARTTHVGKLHSKIPAGSHRRCPRLVRSFWRQAELSL
jgi:hypothetical protein